MNKTIMFIILLIAAISAISFINYKRRRAYLLKKYNNEEIVDNIMARRIWQGMTKEQLIDSWGKPAGRDHKVMKTKFSETYKYSQVGRNRFRSRVMLENDVVIGWQQR